MAVQGDLVETFRDDFSRAVSPIALTADAIWEPLPLAGTSSLDIAGGVWLPKTASTRLGVLKAFPIAVENRLADFELTMKVNIGSDVTTAYSMGFNARGWDVNNYLRFRLTTGGTPGPRLVMGKVENNIARDFSGGTANLPTLLVPNTTLWLRAICSGNQLTMQAFGSDPFAGSTAAIATANYLLTDISEVQTLSISGTPTSGNFALTYNPPSGITESTTVMSYASAASAVRTRLEALPSIGVGNVTCTGGPLPAAITITFTGALANADLDVLTISSNTVVGGTPTVATTTHGLSTARWGIGGLGRVGIYHASSSITAAPNAWTVDDFVVREPLMPYTYWGNFDEIHDGTSELISKFGNAAAIGDVGLFSRGQVLSTLAAYDLRAGTIPWNRPDFAWRKKTKPFSFG